jgi:class 3 adenylate cyclase/tetratricopeptide (TPR) repeat protein
VTTENVAILFTDIVGSTALSQRLSAEVADEVRRGHFSILRQAITEAGGTEVKNLGDGLMVVFSSASGALGCAVGMQQGVEQGNHEDAEPVGLRIGLSVGEVSNEEGDYFGDPVVEAARLCSRCDAGQILATDLVRAMAGRRSRQECRSLGELTLKGLPVPVESIEVIWEPLDGFDLTEVIPLPARLAVQPEVGVVGRDADVTAIADAVKEIGAGGKRQILLVSGEAGLGKTTLVAEAARSAFNAGACVLFGHCEEDLATSYQLFAEALGHYVTHAPEQQLAAHVETHGSELSRLVPALNSRIPDLPPSKATDSDTERFLLFSAAVSLLTKASEHQPVVLVLDDLQWADKGSMLLLRHLASADPTMRVLILGTYRDSELSNAEALLDALAALRRLEGITRIELVGLDHTGVVALMEAGAGHQLDDAAVGLAQAIFRETDGNPFFVSEVLRHLVETGAIGQNAEGRWVAEDTLDAMALPNSLREVIGARVLRLGKGAGPILSMGAVIGRDFDLQLLALATNRSEDEVLDVLDAAAAASLVRELADSPGRFTFAHALIQHTLAEDLGPTRRARAHRNVAEALEKLCGNRPGIRVGELARHWTAAQPIDLPKAISYSCQAGDAALSALAPADALRYYARALDLEAHVADPDPVRGLDLAIGIGTAQRQTGDPCYRETLLDAARGAAALGDTDRLVAAALANNRGWFSAAGAIDTEKVEVLEIALERLPADHTARAVVLSTLCSELAYGSPLERRQVLADEAMAIAESSGDDALIVRVLNNLFAPLLVPSLHEQSLARTADSLARAERVGDPVLVFFAAFWRAYVACQASDIHELDRCLDAIVSLTARLEQPMLSWSTTAYRAARSLIAGDTDRAEELATEALKIGTDSGQPDAPLFFGTHLIGINQRRGTLGELAPFLEQMAADAPTVAGALTAVLALAHAEADRLDNATRLLEELATTDFELPVDSVWLTAVVEYADAAIEVQDPKYARPLFDLLVPWADQFASVGIAGAEGPVSHYLGGLASVLGRYDEADNYFAYAAAVNDRAGAKFFAARTDLRWGQMLSKRDAPGDAEAARELLTKAHAIAAEHGYGNVERRAATALQVLA